MSAQLTQLAAVRATTLPGSAGLELADGMSLPTMLLIGLVGLLVVTFGGLALAVGLGLLTGRRRKRDDDDGGDDGTLRDSTGTPFK